MTRALLRPWAINGLFVVALAIPEFAFAQDSFATARELYVSAAYEDALAVLNRLTANAKPSDRLRVNEYRAFCLVALRRNEEADEAIEAVLSEEPSYNPAGADASPRLLSAFASGRQRILPSIVQKKYAHAKARYDHQEFAAAAVEFDQVLKVLSYPDLAQAASRPPLSDLRTLAVGFHDLSIRNSPPPPAPVPEMPALPVRMAARVYNLGEPRVSPPVVIRQDMPAVPGGFVIRGQGVLEVIISEDGIVESAVIRTPMDPRYDQLLLSATRLWRFEPAMVGAKPVKFRKMIGVKADASSGRTP